MFGVGVVPKAADAWYVAAGFFTIGVNVTE